MDGLVESRSFFLLECAFAEYIQTMNSMSVIIPVLSLYINVKKQNLFSEKYHNLCNVIIVQFFFFCAMTMILYKYYYTNNNRSNSSKCFVMSVHNVLKKKLLMFFTIQNDRSLILPCAGLIFCLCCLLYNLVQTFFHPLV